jgi:hypothetical protein
VTVGVTEGARVEITSGVAPGDMAVTDGQDKLQPGSKVTVQGAPGGRVQAQPQRADQGVRAQRAPRPGALPHKTQ